MSYMARIRDPLVISGVVGDVVDSISNSLKLNVVYNSNKQVFNSHELTPSSLTFSPKVEFQGKDIGSYFTLIMVDPDVPGPSNPYLREHIHWIVNNIPGTMDSSFGTEVLSYEKPAPNIGIHRFVFLLFKQMGSQTMAAPESRDNFSTRIFAEKYDLGQPVGAVYFNCRKEKAPKKAAH